MSALDTAKAVLAKASLLDSSITHADIGVAVAWSEALGNIGRDDALAAVVEHYTRPTPPRIMPGDVIAGVRRRQNARVKDHFEDFAELDPLADDPAAYIRELRRLRRQVANATYRPSVQHAVRTRNVQELLEDAVGKLPQMPRYIEGEAS